MFGKKTIKLASILLALLLALSLSSCGLLALVGPNINGGQNSSNDQIISGGSLPGVSDSAFPELDLIDYFFEQLSVLDLDRDKLVTAILKA